ncbi:MAG: formate dehydrogenase accessory sulfurtransferase FdhD [Phenylobacterium sp.]|uniref:formate dehydrogenase accessory sulfurtransferase FdhD n=1 Tax=Phenylobacterium sp. TaxID=1871053 RepID=UPI0012008E5C|nr:formate dehydrogenase accessory sulfurtransferase FdhD [Phenylobacterium sp.]TAJ72910.1 MAG: formate dehydrogenase accessory sulfurtransferase FdhD [Phenylobacterium sp.]
MPDSVATTVGRIGLEWRPATGMQAVERITPAEVAIGLSFNSRPHTVLMATPDDVEDLAVGFAVTEGVATPAEIIEVSVERRTDGILADLRLAPAGPARRARPRTLEGRSSCGLCGVQRLADAIRPLPAVTSGAQFSHAAIQRAVAALGPRQALGGLTRATHAAGFADVHGALGLVREDVGRHNALDKLGGALLQAGVDPAGGFVVVTSRCSFEMVEKTARLGCPMIVAVSAPTDLAIQRAEAAGVTLVALARADGHTVFSRTDRLVGGQVPTPSEAAHV